MAKSIRSKWKRKCRAIKRERYGKKELDRLKKTLGITDSQEGDKDVTITEADLEAAETVTLTTIKEIKEKQQQEETEEQMEVDKRIFNTKTLRDQHGAYPVWLHPRKIKKSKNKKKAKKGRKTK